MRLKRELQAVSDAKDLCDLALARHRKDGGPEKEPSQDSAEGQTLFTRLTRDLMLAEIQEKILARRYNNLQEELRIAQGRELNVTNELMEMERVLKVPCCLSCFSGLVVSNSFNPADARFRAGKNEPHSGGTS